MENLKSNLSTYYYPNSLIKQGFQKALSIPQKDLRKPKKPSNENILPFITTFNPNNLNICCTIKTSVICLKNNNVSNFHNINLIQSKRQPSNLKKFLTRAEYREVLSGMFNYSDKRCECCNYLLANDHYTFKITFKLKNRFTCNSFNLIYVICDTCKEEYIGETEEGKTKLRDRVRVYHQNICQPHYQLSKVEGHLRVFGNGKFRTFPLLQIRSQDTNLRRSYETRFQQKFKTQLNKL